MKKYFITKLSQNNQEIYHFHILPNAFKESDKNKIKKHFNKNNQVEISLELLNDDKYHK